MARKTVTNADLARTLAALTKQVDALAEQAELRERVAKLEALVETLQDSIDQMRGAEQGGGMLLGAGLGPVTAYSGQDDPDTQVVDADDMVRALHEQLTAAHDPDSDFVMDDIEVDMGGGIGSEGGKVRLGVNAREGAKGGSATSRIKFNLRRKVVPKVIE